MRIVHRIATVILAVAAVIGLACGTLAALSAANVVRPLVVTSGSMEPGINAGDLLVATRIATETIQVGDVITLESAIRSDRGLVTHRVESIKRDADGTFTIEMKGDAADRPDALPYTAGQTLLKPAIQIPGGGDVAEQVTLPTTTIPLLVGLLGVLGVALMTPQRRSTGPTGPDPATADTAIT